MTNKNLVKLGFKPLNHSNIGNSHILFLGRDRWLSIKSIGTPNEMVFVHEKNVKEVSEIIVVHNYDYDGYLTFSKLDRIYNVFTNKHLKTFVLNNIITFLERLSYAILIVLGIEALITNGRALEIETYTPIAWFVQSLIFTALLAIVVGWEKE